MVPGACISVSCTVAKFLFLLLWNEQEEHRSLEAVVRKAEISSAWNHTFSDKVRYEGGHGKCCRFGTLTGVHQGRHICPGLILGSMKTFGAKARQRSVTRKKKQRQDVLPLSLSLGVLLWFVASAANVVVTLKSNIAFSDGARPAIFF